MSFLTVREAAELRGCSPRYIRRLIADGRIEYVETDAPANQIKQYMIPVAVLSPKEQRRYYAQRGVLSGDAAKVPTSEADKPKRQRAFDEYTEAEREQIQRWSQLVKEWRTWRTDSANGPKVGIDERFVAMVNQRDPDISLSLPTLRRKWSAYKQGNLDGLVDKRGQWRKGQTSINVKLWDVFLSYYLEENQFPLAKCVEYTEMWAQQLAPELLPLPHEAAFRRYLEIDVPHDVIVLAREGDKAFKDRCAPYISRFYDDLESNEYWVGDTHTIDVISQVEGSEKRHRLYIVAFQDVRSGIYTGWHITDKPSSQATLLALRHGIIQCGIPTNIYVDNGREFLNFDVGGLGHRTKKSQKDAPTPPPIFERLGIHMVNALVRNARAKIIERTFCDFKNSISRLFDTYTGGNVLEKPEILKKNLKNGAIPFDDDVKSVIVDMLEGYHNVGEYGGRVVKDRGKRRIDIYNENLITRRTATAENLSLLLMRSTRPQTVRNNGVYLTVSGQRLDYWDTDLLMGPYKGKQVYLRYDPDDLNEVRLYDPETDCFIQTVPMDDICRLKYGDTHENVSAAMKEQRAYEKAVKTKTAYYKKRLDPEEQITALALNVENARMKKEGIAYSQGRIIEPVRPQGEEQRVASGGGVVVDMDMDRILRNAAKRNN